jgi:hypothetical protein
MVEERVKELVEDMFNEYFYTNKLTESEIDVTDCSVESFAIGDIANFYLVKFKSTVIGSVFSDEERCIISNYSRRNDGEGNNLEYGKLRESITH